MQPTCFLLGTVHGETVLYLEQVSTIECLEQLPQADPVRVIGFGATLPDGNWIDWLELSPDAVVADVVKKLKDNSQMSIVHFAASVGSIRFSTHDDGEADFRFGSQEEGLAFLRRALTPAGSTELIPQLLENLGRYVTKQEGSWRSFSTFDAYRASELTVADEQ